MWLTLARITTIIKESKIDAYRLEEDKRNSIDWFLYKTSMKRFKKKKNKTRNYELLNNSIGVKDKDRFNEFSQDNEF